MRFCLSIIILLNKIAQVLALLAIFYIIGSLKNWQTFKNDFSLNDSYLFKWRQIRHSIPRTWIDRIQNNLNAFILSNGNLQEQHIQFKNRDIPLEKLSSKLFYIMLSSKVKCKSNSESNIQAKLPNHIINWPKSYTYARKVTLDSFARMFNFKILHNRLFLNQSLHSSGLVGSPLCSYCGLDDEDTIHLFCNCFKAKLLWEQIRSFFMPQLNLPTLTRQNALLGLPDSCTLLSCHLHLIFKISMYKKRDTKNCNFQYFLSMVKNIMNIESQISFSNVNKKEINRNKWLPIINKLRD